MMTEEELRAWTKARRTRRRVDWVGISMVAVVTAACFVVVWFFLYVRYDPQSGDIGWRQYPQAIHQKGISP